MSGYLRYLGERLVIFLATVIISITIVFVIPRLVPGDPLGALSVKLAQVGANLGSRELIDEYMRRFGLDKSIPEQYVAYLRQLSQGDLGYSISAFPTHGIAQRSCGVNRLPRTSSASPCPVCLSS